MDGKLLIDFPSEIYMHVLYKGLDLVNVKSVLLTHAHEDHLNVQDLKCRDSNKLCFDGEICDTLTISKVKFRK